ncbi:MAG: MORN repeat-containing protein, partial [Clostridia bacterium]
GHFTNGVPDGLGTYTWAAGDRYTGELKAGIQTGKGTYTNKNGDHYAGHFENGRMVGVFTVTWANKTRYIGLLKNGKPHGQGTLVWATGGMYIGEFANGVRHGQGTYTSATGEKNSGQFRNNLLEGTAVIIMPNGEIRRGEYAAGKQVKSYDTAGYKQYTYKDGTVAVGVFQGNTVNGELVLTSPNGMTFVGEGRMVNGSVVTRGVVRYPYGVTYLGTFVNGINEGPGVLQTAGAQDDYVLHFHDGLLVEQFQAKTIEQFEPLSFKQLEAVFSKPGMIDTYKVSVIRNTQAKAVDFHQLKASRNSYGAKSAESRTHVGQSTALPLTGTTEDPLMTGRWLPQLHAIPYVIAGQLETLSYE